MLDELLIRHVEPLQFSLTERWQPFLADLGTSERGTFYQDWGAVAYAYKQAADELANKTAMNTHGAERFSLPIAFLYRHWVELELKAAIEQLEGSVAKTHDLFVLWKTLHSCCIALGLFAEDDEFVRHVGHVIRHLDKYDKFSVSFRYPEGDEPRSKFLEIDFYQLVACMDDVDTLFFGLRAMMRQ